MRRSTYTCTWVPRRARRFARLVHTCMLRTFLDGRCCYITMATGMLYHWWHCLRWRWRWWSPRSQWRCQWRGVWAALTIGCEWHWHWHWHCQCTAVTASAVTDGHCGSAAATRTPALPHCTGDPLALTASGRLAPQPASESVCFRRRGPPTVTVAAAGSSDHGQCQWHATHRDARPGPRSLPSLSAGPPSTHLAPLARR